MQLTAYKERSRMVVLGLGMTGFSVVCWARKHAWNVVVVDSRVHPPVTSRLQHSHADVALYTPDQFTVRQDDVVIISPGLPPHTDWVQAIVQQVSVVLTDMDIFCQAVKKPIVAITGSNGKTTVAKLVHACIEASGQSCTLVGNVGSPVLDALDNDEVDLYVVEMSSFQLHWMQSFNAKIAAILNLFPNHLDWHDDMQAYWAAKKRILDRAEYAVLADALKTYMHDAVQDGKSMRVSSANDHARDDAKQRIRWIPHAETMFESDLRFYHELPCVTPYLLQSFVSARVIAQALDIPDDAIRKAFLAFKPWPYRCQLESNATIQGIWYNDAKSSNLAAAAYALNHVWKVHQKTVYWIAGGVAKGEDLRRVSQFANRIKRAYVYGQDAGTFADALHECCVQVGCYHDLQQVIGALRLVVQDVDVVVFSPASASFDQFANFEHRGRCFSEYVSADEYA